MGGAGSQPKELFATRDGGQRWTIISQTYAGVAPVPTPTATGGIGWVPMQGYVIGLTFLDPDTAHLSLARRPTLVKTEDGGRSWTSVVPACERGTCVFDGVIDTQFVSESQGYWIPNFPRAGLYGTNDGGKTSMQVYPPPSDDG